MARYARMWNVSATSNPVAAVSGKRIRVMSFSLSLASASGTPTATFKSGNEGALLTGAYPAGGTVAAAEGGLFQTAKGAALRVVIAGGVSNRVNAHLAYELV